jgi:hypothetical protein
MTDESIRPSKAVLTSGPGAIIDLKGGRSAIVMSPDYWQRYEVIYEKRLAEDLDVNHFRSPACGWVRTDDGFQRAGYGSGTSLGIGTVRSAGGSRLERRADIAQAASQWQRCPPDWSRHARAAI